MFSFLSNFFQKNHIDTFAPLPLSACRITRPYLLDHAGIKDGSVVLFAVPYFSPACLDEKRNLSSYAVARDYHLFFKSLFDELLPQLRRRFPSNRFAGFSDHSPIAEIEAAARAGLGVIGKNRLLITKKYSSYVFIGELITDAMVPCQAGEITACENCGRCDAVCPMKKSGCLSELTQKKGNLTEDEARILLESGTVWGCDLCQEVCPHTMDALQSGSIFSPIPYFNQETLACMQLSTLDAMSDTAFSSRAYAWRSKETIRRNLILFENQGKEN